MKRVYIWLIERTDDVGWDETAGAVIAAHTEKEALAVQPGEYSSWPTLSTFKVTKIGTAAIGIKAGTVLLQDYRAG